MHYAGAALNDHRVPVRILTKTWRLSITRKVVFVAGNVTSGWYRPINIQNGQYQSMYLRSPLRLPRASWCLGESKEVMCGDKSWLSRG